MSNTAISHKSPSTLKGVSHSTVKNRDTTKSETKNKELKNNLLSQSSSRPTEAQQRSAKQYAKMRNSSTATKPENVMHTRQIASATERRNINAAANYPVRTIDTRNARIYYPEGAKDAPIIGFGGGTGGSPANYTQLFEKLASEGYIVAGARASWAGSGDEMVDAVNDVQAFARDPSHPLFDIASKHPDGTLDQLVFMGHSQGGAGAGMAAGKDARADLMVGLMPYFSLPMGGSAGMNTMERVSIPSYHLIGERDGLSTPTSIKNAISRSPGDARHETLNVGHRAPVNGYSPEVVAGPVTNFLAENLNGMSNDSPSPFVPNTPNGEPPRNDNTPENRPPRSLWNLLRWWRW